MRDTHGSVPIQEDDMDEKIKELREARTAREAWLAQVTSDL